tara:strand:+ start:95 stop:583 length:489 start_codon:yes stop_codon:yes gene_type:complete
MRIVNSLKFKPETDLEEYLKWVVHNISFCPPTVIKNNLSFTDGMIGFVLHREGQFQTQLFIGEPDVVIPNHIHPNVDSFEVALHGATLRHSGMIILTPESDSAGMALYVGHDHWHGGFASKDGGCFLSVQKWLNGVPPSSVENDWGGDTIGPEHDSKVISNP